MVTNGPIAELGRSLRSLQTVAFLLVRRGDESSVAAAGAAHRPKPPHLNHTALKLGHLGVAWKHLSSLVYRTKADTKRSGWRRLGRELWDLIHQLPGTERASTDRIIG